MNKDEILTIIKDNFSVAAQIRLSIDILKSIPSYIEKKDNESELIQSLSDSLAYKKPDYLNIEIRTLALSIRLLNCLLNSGCKIVGDIIPNINDVKSQSNFGAVCAKELYNFLKLNLGFDDKELAQYRNKKKACKTQAINPNNKESND